MSRGHVRNDDKSKGHGSASAAAKLRMLFPHHQQQRQEHQVGFILPEKRMSGNTLLQ
jgi:hypothetical protein